MKNKSILDKSISLWWNSLGEYEKQHILTRNKFVGVLVTDEWKAKCYHTEHPTNPLLEIPTDNKGEVNWKLEYDILYKERDEIREVSHKRKEQNAKLLSDIKVLRVALEGIDSLLGFSINATQSGAVRNLLTDANIIAKSALEKTKYN